VIERGLRRAPQLEFWRSQNGKPSGDPVRLAVALLTVAAERRPPRRFIASADAIATTEQKVADLRAQIDVYRNVSTALDSDLESALHTCRRTSLRIVRNAFEVCVKTV
jgi:hypothetical protein